jgi:hypothetical protein
MLLTYQALPAVLKGVVSGRVKGRCVCRKHNRIDRDDVSVVNVAHVPGRAGRVQGRCVCRKHKLHNMMLLMYQAVQPVLKGVVSGHVKGRCVCRKNKTSEMMCL